MQPLQSNSKPAIACTVAHMLALLVLIEGPTAATENLDSFQLMKRLYKLVAGQVSDLKAAANAQLKAEGELAVCDRATVAWMGKFKALERLVNSTLQREGSSSGEGTSIRFSSSGGAASMPDWTLDSTSTRSSIADPYVHSSGGAETSSCSAGGDDRSDGCKGSSGGHESPPTINSQPTHPSTVCSSSGSIPDAPKPVAQRHCLGLVGP